MVQHATNQYHAKKTKGRGRKGVYHKREERGKEEGGGEEEEEDRMMSKGSTTARGKWGKGNEEKEGWKPFPLWMQWCLEEVPAPRAGYVCVQCVRGQRYQDGTQCHGEEKRKKKRKKGLRKGKKGKEKKKHKMTSRTQLGLESSRECI